MPSRPHLRIVPAAAPSETPENSGVTQERQGAGAQPPFTLAHRPVMIGRPFADPIDLARLNGEDDALRAAVYLEDDGFDTDCRIIGWGLLAATLFVVIARIAMMVSA